jgi:hypothetical protein
VSPINFLIELGICPAFCPLYKQENAKNRAHYVNLFPEPLTFHHPYKVCHCSDAIQEEEEEEEEEGAIKLDMRISTNSQSKRSFLPFPLQAQPKRSCHFEKHLLNAVK